MKKIFFSINTIRDLGGISTTALNLLNYLASENKYDITLCILSGDIGKDVVIPEEVRILHPSSFYHNCFTPNDKLLNLSFFEKFVCYSCKVLKKIIGVERTVKYAIKKTTIDESYDLALAFYSDTYSNGKLSVGGDFDLVSQRVNAERKVAWVHNDSYKLGYSYDICKKIFANYDAIVNVSQDGKKTFDSIIPEYASKSFVVYNLYNIDEILAKSEHKIDYPQKNVFRFITVCRMSDKQKKVSRILNTCKKLVDSNILGFEWLLIGEGPHLQRYQDFVSNNNLGNYVRFLGLQSNPYPYIKSSDAFVLASLYEGLPVTVKEAQILFCPPLVTNFGSASEAIEDTKTGIICDNSQEGLDSLILSVMKSKTVVENVRDYLIEHPVDNSLAIRQLKEVCKL